VQREILEADEEADIRVYALWVPFLGGTQDAAELSQRVLPDPRVRHYWDEDAPTSAWFAESVEHRSVRLGTSTTSTTPTRSGPRHRNRW
jgi:hypothetical protein